MGQAVSYFFTTTIFDVAIKAWTIVVDGVTALAKSVGRAVKSFVTSVINGMNTIAGNVKEFFIRFWDNVEEFTRMVLGMKPKLKDTMCTAAYDIGGGLKQAGVNWFRITLKEMGNTTVDSLTDDEVAVLWKKYMGGHDHFTTKEENELKDIVKSREYDHKLSSTGGYSKLSSLDPVPKYVQYETNDLKERLRAISSDYINSNLTGGYRKLDGISLPVTASPYESEEFKDRKYHVNLVLVFQEHISKGASSGPFGQGSLFI